MSGTIEALSRLVNALSKLPGIGGKSAQRLAYYIIAQSETDVRELAEAIYLAKKKIRHCTLCGGLSETEVCPMCSDPKRDSTVICVVKDPRDIAAVERTRDFRGLYHVLHGTISPMQGIGPDDIRLKELLGRLDGVKEVILATNPDVEGDATAAYIARLIKPLGLRVTRLAYGLPVGGNLEYTDEVTLSQSIEWRRDM